MLKDDNLGLGAKRGNAEGETFGLDGLQTLLGRLNGKSEEVLQKEEEARRDVKLTMYNERRFGTLRFISGGFLEGDNIEQMVHSDNKGSETDASATNMTSRKRKRKHIEQLDAQPNSALVVDKPRKKREPKESGHVQQVEGNGGKRRTKFASLELDSNTEGQRGVTLAQTPSAIQEPEVVPTAIEIEVERKKRKAEKKLRKESKLLPNVKNLEKRKGADKPVDETAALDTAAMDGWNSSDREVAHQTKSSSGPIQLRGRHLVRQRYIRQKQMASKDEQALREVSINHFQRIPFYANVICLDFHD